MPFGLPKVCKALKLKSVNIVRDRPNLDELKAELYQLGADHVLTEQELRYLISLWFKTLSF
jgi:trans-2-enoyl-CoA reductase